MNQGHLFLNRRGERYGNEEADRSGSASGKNKRGIRTGKVDSSRSSVHPAPVVGAAAIGGGAGCDMGKSGG